ncbi:MAG: DNA internalization-related competence protein ComEC/Rec2 [Halieaceae bacterium]
MIVSAAAVFAIGWMPVLLPLPALFAAGLTALLACLCWPRSRLTLGLTALLAGASYATWWGEDLLQSRLPSQMEDTALEVIALVLEPPARRTFSHGGSRQRFPATLELLSCPVASGDCPQQLKPVLLSYYGDKPIKAGERWRFTVKLKQPRGLSNPGSFNYESWLAQNAVVATGYAREKGARRLSAASGVSRPHQRWRQRVADAIDQEFGGRAEHGVLLALSTGDRSAINPEQWQQFQRFGLNHLVVISGLHVGLVAGLGFLLGRVLGRRWAHGMAAATALLYSALAGFAMPTLRALIMLASVQLGALLGRKIRPARSMTLALFAVALVDPLATHGVGFWLSFGAVACIFYLRHMHPGLGGLQLTLLLQLLLSIAMGVVASFWFGGIGWLAPLANLLAVPILTFYLAPLCLLAACCLFFEPELALLLWQWAALPVQGFYWINHALADLQWPLWLHLRPSLWAILAFVLGLLWLLARSGTPLRWLAVVLLCMPLLPLRSGLAPGVMEVWLLDVGQGLAAVVQTQDRVVVYDTGAGDPAGPNMASSVLIPFLESRGIDAIDLLIISHGDRDHASGVASLQRRFPIAETWYGDQPFKGFAGQQACRAGTSRRWHELEMRQLWPPASLVGISSNNRSCVVQLRFGSFSLLLPGDIEAHVERHLVREQALELEAEVLVVPHHGSRSSSSSPFLGAVSPDVALLSRGYRNRFGHPHREVMARYQRRGISVCDTAEHGALQIIVHSDRVHKITSWRQQRAYYWSGIASTACAPAYNGAQSLH